VLEPANPQATNDMARGVQEASGSKTSARAIQLFKAAVAKDPNLWEARYDLGVLLAHSGELSSAQKELRAARTLAPNAEDVVVALAEVERRLGDAAAAAATLEGFVRRHPTAIAARIGLVGALRDSGKIEQAIGHAREILVRRPNDPNALAELALSHLRRGEADTARLLIQEALKADAKSAVAERTAGLIALDRGDDALAFQHFVRASDLDPSDTTARFNMATVLLLAGIYAKAADEFRAVLAIDPDDTAAQLGYAAALRGQGTRDKPAPYQEAEKTLRNLLEKQPNNVSALHNLAVLYLDFMNRPKDAKPLLERFLSAAPERHAARADAEKRLAAIR
jgi:tetratricopeptide (TPR) repeat protein